MELIDWVNVFAYRVSVDEMCLKLRKSGSDVRITSMTASENGKGENKGWDKQTIIQKRTEDTIVLRDMHRYVWR